MKKLVILLLLCPTLLFAATSKIQNCSTIESSGYILSNTIPGAYFYEFELTNLNSGQSLIVTSQGPSASLNLFSSIITYNSSYKVRVRAAISNERDPDFTDWSKFCEFNIGKQPKYIGITNRECGTEITDINTIFYSNQIYTADCYTFYISNMTTGQSVTIGCIVDHFFTFSSSGINFNQGDVITVEVTYTIGGEESERSEPCEFRIGAFDNSRRNFCAVIKDDYDPYFEDHGLTKTTIPGQNVGSRFWLSYLDNSSGAMWTPAVWEPDAQNMFNTAIAVLEDLDAFLDLNFVNDNCGNPNQKIHIALRPYLQSWTDLNLYPNALAVAGQFVPNVDVNYLSQGCIETPAIQLATINSPHGNYGTITAGTIYFNPTVNNFNSLYPAATPSGQYDLYSVILHEITHILGINMHDAKFHNMIQSNNVNIEDPDLLNCTNHPNYSSMTTATCSNVSLVGIYSNDLLYAPTAFEPLSSLSHFVDDCNGTPQGGNVMHPFLGYADDSKRFYHQREINALQDLGYNFSNPFNGVNYNLTHTDYIVGNHDGINVQYGPANYGFHCDGAPYTAIVNEICGTWPLVINPLDNDINATFISEAVMKTGGNSGTVNITGNNELQFTATQPGIYTIAYIPANSEREGIATYIQITVPSCGDSDLINLTCHNSNNCNQICFGDIYENTLLRGNQFTEPNGFGSNDYFELGATYSINDNMGTSYVPCYSSIFFWIDTDVNKEYSISLERDYHENGQLTYGNPDMNFYVYLMKSSEVMDGQISQTDNAFPNFNGYSKQLVYHELINADNIWMTDPNITISNCIVSDSEYDMLVFYCDQELPFSQTRSGKIGIQNLEFMEKEFPSYTLPIVGCLPGNLNLGTPFCALSSNTYTWVEQSNGGTVSTNQLLNLGNVNTPVIEQYVFTMSYPNLPSTAIFPVSNSSCSETQSTYVEVVNCCTDGSTPFLHPLTTNATSRTYGTDVDAIGNSLYYAGTYHDIYNTGVGFGNNLTFSTSYTSQDGFIAKFEDDCLDWIVTKLDHTDLKLEIGSGGEVFQTSRHSFVSLDEFQRIDPVDGSELWDVQLAGPGNLITDFVIDNVNQRVYISGHSETYFQFGGFAIHDGIMPPQSFILAVDFNGSYVGHNSTNTNAYIGHSFLGLDEANGILFQVFRETNQSWRMNKWNSGNLNSQYPETNLITCDNNIHVSAVEFDPSTNLLFTQLVYGGNVTNGVNLPIATTSNPRMAIVKSNNQTLISQGAVSDLWIGNTGLYNFYSSYDRPAIDIENGVLYNSYTSALGVVTNEARNSAAPHSIIWTDDIYTLSAGTAFSGAIEKTDLGVFSTGTFFTDLQVGPFVLNANNGALTFYGVKYDNTGTVSTMNLNNNNPSTSSNGTKSQLNVSEIESHHQKIKIYPNPGKDIFIIEAEENYSVEIFDLNGRTIMTFNSLDQSSFDLTNYSSGIYQVIFRSESEIETFKIIKMD